MASILKREPLEHTDISKTANQHTSVTINEGMAGFVDFTASRLALDIEMVCQEGNTDIILPVTYGIDGQDVNGPSSLIRNAAARSSRWGILNPSNNTNVINANLYKYLSGRAKKDAQASFGQSTGYNEGRGRRSGLPDNPRIIYSRPIADGDTVDSTDDPTVTRRSYDHLDWWNIDKFGRMDKFPLLVMGDYTIDLDFEDQKDVVGPAWLGRAEIQACDDINLAGGDDTFGTTDNPIVITRTRANQWFNPKVGQLVQLMFKSSTGPVTSVWQEHIITSTTVDANGKWNLEVLPEVNAAAANDDITDMYIAYYNNEDEAVLLSQNITPVGNEIGNAATPLVLQNHYSGTEGDSDECKLYVGQPIKVVSRENGVDIFTVDTTVESLERDGRDLKVVLADGLDVGTNNAQSYVTIGARFGSATERFTCSWLVHNGYAEYVDVRLRGNDLQNAMNSLKNGLALDFLDFVVEKRTATASTLYSEVIQVPPNTVGYAVLTPQNLALLSGFDTANSYRFWLNNKPVTNRDITVGQHDNTSRQLHNYMLNRFYANVGLPLARYDGQVVSSVSPDNQTNCGMFCMAVPKVPMEQNIQVQLYADTAMAQKDVFHLILVHKQLQISNGRVVIETVNLVE